MKLGNFASFDPAHKSRNVKGLQNVSNLDRALWEEFQNEPNRIAEESEEAFNKLSLPDTPVLQREPDLPTGPTEVPVTRPMRLVQSFFRRCVLASYGYKCSFCGLEIPDLLNASHIIPWNISKELRADPRNGFCLCALHDRAFDRGLITVGTDYRLVIARELKRKNPVALHRVAFIDLDGERINLPSKFLPAAACLDYHRKECFSG